MGDDHSIFSEHLRLFLNIFFFVNIGAIRMHGVVEGPRGITQTFCITFETLRICVKIYLGIFFKKKSWHYEDCVVEGPGGMGDDHSMTPARSSHWHSSLISQGNTWAKS